LKKQGLSIAPVRRDNRSAFFSRLRQREKSAMAEILVSDQCARRPTLLVDARFTSRGSPQEEEDRSNLESCKTSSAHASLYFRCH
jgi:hypothetical protein